ncbi:MAG TPA: YhbY family RNA-binding protein [Woeseiaceae bacterium]|nr:YhbY family RNA-binding protein [Woeseiaceae bacterium]
MQLSESRKKFLRGLGHQLKPIVSVGGAGVTDALLREFCATIAHHELVKVRVRAGDRERRDAAIGELCRRGEAALVTRIGNVALFYRRNPDDPKIQLPP